MKLTAKQQELAKQYQIKQAKEAIKATEKGAQVFQHKNPLGAQLLSALDSESLLQRATEKENKFHPRPKTRMFDEIQFSLNTIWRRKLESLETGGNAD